MGTSNDGRARTRLLFDYLQSGLGEDTSHERREQLAVAIVDSSIGPLIDTPRKLHIIRQALDRLARMRAFEVASVAKTGVRVAASKHRRKQG